MPTNNNNINHDGRKACSPRSLFDILLSDVKNERRADEKGVVTLAEIAAQLGFVNRSDVSGDAAKVKSPLNGIVVAR